MNSFRSKGFGEGANDYIRSIADSVVDKAEVLERGRVFQREHRRFRILAFSNRAILKKCIELLDQLAQKNVRWDFVFELSMNEKEKLTQIKSKLPCVRGQIEDVLSLRFEPVPKDLCQQIDSTSFRTDHLRRWTVEGLRQKWIDDGRLITSYVSYGESKKILADSCLMLVVKIAHQFRSSGNSLIELVQDGNVGVMIAAEKYDPSLGWNFTAYASHWIRRHIFLGLARRALIKVPLNKKVDINRFLQASGSLAQGLGRKLSAEEQHELLADNKLCESQISSCCRLPVSLAQFDDRDHSGSPFVVESNRQSDCPVESLHRKELQSSVTEVIHRLGDREKKILEMRFGLNGEAEHSLASIARHTGLSHQRIHQIIANLKNELRNQLTSFC